MNCLNPPIKSERIIQLKKSQPILNNLSCLLTNDLTSIINDKSKVEEIVKELDALKNASSMITYTEWSKKKSERSTGLISTKTVLTDSMNIFCTKFSEEISVSIPKEKLIKKSDCYCLFDIKNLQQHMELVHVQSRGTKRLRQEASTCDNVVTLQIDWSENYHLQQARQERCKLLYKFRH